MGSKKNVDMSANESEVKIVEEPQADDKKKTEATDEVVKSAEPTTEGSARGAASKKKPARVRSKKYQAVRSQVDKTRSYDPFSAFELIKKLSYSKFDGSITAHLVVRETGATASLSFPHSTGKSVTVAIASDKVIKQIEAGKTDFDVLLSTAQYMPQLTKHARVLGPKGLMPNPKNGTLTDKPEARKKELEAGKMTLRTEKQAPLLHVAIGKVSMDTKKLSENLQTLLHAFQDKVVKVSLSASMSPGIRVALDQKN